MLIVINAYVDRDRLISPYERDTHFHREVSVLQKHLGSIFVVRQIEIQSRVIGTLIGFTLLLTVMFSITTAS